MDIDGLEGVPWRLEHEVPKESCSWVCSGEEENKGGISPQSAAGGRCGQDGARLCGAMPRDRAEGKGHELEQGRNREKYFPLRAVKC